MYELDITYNAENDTHESVSELSAKLADESFVDDHVITLTPSEALMAARALCFYAPWLENVSATYFWDHK